MMMKHFPWDFMFGSMWSQDSEGRSKKLFNSKFQVSGVLFIIIKGVAQGKVSMVSASLLGLFLDMTVVFLVRIFSWREVIGLVRI